MQANVLKKGHIEDYINRLIEKKYRSSVLITTHIRGFAARRKFAVTRKIHRACIQVSIVVLTLVSNSLCFCRIRVTLLF